MRYYPIFLDIADRPVVVIGGGEVALRKVEGLLNAAARITVISPSLHSDLEVLVQQGRVRHIARGYRPGDLDGYVLAFVGTDDRSLNVTVAGEGKERGVWVNAIDDPTNCDFIMPAIVRRGNLTVAISTGGGSPAAARKIREDMEGSLTDEYVLLVEVAAEVRRELLSKDILVDAEVWSVALDSDFRTLLAQGKRQEAKECLLSALLKPVEAE